MTSQPFDHYEANKLELVSRCLFVLFRLGREKAKDSLYYDIDGYRIDAWRWQEDCMELQLSLTAPSGFRVFSIKAQPTIGIEAVKREPWPEFRVNEVLTKLRTAMVLDELAGVVE